MTKCVHASSLSSLSSPSLPPSLPPYLSPSFTPSLPPYLSPSLSVLFCSLLRPGYPVALPAVATPGLEELQAAYLHWRLLPRHRQGQTQVWLTTSMAVHASTFTSAACFRVGVYPDSLSVVVADESH